MDVYWLVGVERRAFRVAVPLMPLAPKTEGRWYQESRSSRGWETYRWLLTCRKDYRILNVLKGTR